MNCFDGDLLELKRKVAKKQRLGSKLAELRAQKRALEESIKELRTLCEKEQADVEQLEADGLKNRFYKIIGKMSALLTKERNEAAAAMARLSAAEYERDNVFLEMKQLREQLDELIGCEQTYVTEYAKRLAVIKEEGSEKSASILTCEERIAFLQNQMTELDEAMLAGSQALITAENIMNELDIADRWNKWDMFANGGIITHVAKYRHMDDAQGLVVELQEDLRRFKTELADIDIRANMEVNVTGFLKFADYFYDGLFVDWAISKRIGEAEGSVMTVAGQIESSLKTLTRMKENTAREIAEMQKQIENFVAEA